MPCQFKMDEAATKTGKIMKGTKREVRKVRYLDGLSEEALSKNFPMDEVRGFKDAMSSVSRIHTEGL